jgi:hypothetical protein
MRTTIFPFVVLATLLAAKVIVLSHPQARSAPISVQSQGPTIQGLERLAHLVTSRVSIADVLVGEGEGCRGAWLIRGDALLGVDLSRAQILDNDEEARRATIGTCFSLHPFSNVAGGRIFSNSIRLGVASCCSCDCALKLGR